MKITGSSRSAGCFRSPRRPITSRKAREKDPSRLPARAKRDVQLRGEIRRVRQENFDVYGVRKVWRQLCREGRDVARCTVARLMREMGLQGGGPWTSIQDDEAGFEQRSPDGPRGSATSTATRPNELWVSDLTYIRQVARPSVYVAFVIDVFARLIVGWRATTIVDCRHRSRCVGAGAARAPTKPRRSIGASQRSRCAVRLDPLHRAARRGGH